MSKEVNLKQLQSFVETQRDSFEGLLQEFVELPTVSADPNHYPDILKCVRLAERTLREFGSKARVYESDGGSPIVHGVFEAGDSNPTVTIYNHLDVVPASMETEPWRTDPFIFSKQNDRYFARGTTDDKGPALAALFGAKAAQHFGVPINVQFLWEFEEEIGSPHFEETIAKVADRLATDSVVVSDTMWISRNRPACSAGLRGFLGLRFILRTGMTDQHSGDVGGGARNPIGELMKLMCQIHDPLTGLVQVPGFYKDVVLPTRKELLDFKRSGFSVRNFKKNYLYQSLRTKDGMDLMKRLWALPTFELHGLVGGYSGPGIKAVVPPEAEVKASCRLVPDQRPENILRLFKTFVKKKNPEVQVIAEAASEPYRATTTGPLADAIKKSMKFAFGREPIFIREGGSIGSVNMMKRVLKCPIMFLSLSLPEHGYHAPNENFDWQQASGGMIAFVKYFEQLSRLRTRTRSPKERQK